MVETKEASKHTVNPEEVAFKQFLSVEETAFYLGVRPSTIYQWVSERRIKHYKIPGSSLLRFKKSELDAFIESGRVETVDENLNRPRKRKGNNNGNSATEEAGR